MQPRTVHELPQHYHESYHLHLTKGRNVIWVNLAAIPLCILSLIIFFGWLLLYYRLGALLVQDWLPDHLSQIIGLILVFGILPVHEWVHGLAIRWIGHRPRYGMKIGVLYATTDGAYFWRNQYQHVALAPLIWISITILIAGLFFPQGVAFWLMAAAVVNASGATGDLWMVWTLRKFPADALVRDEADGMRVFVPA